MQDILNFNLKELGEKLAKYDYPSFHSRQIFSWIYKKGITDFRQMTDLAQGLRSHLEENFSIGKLQLIQKFISSDGTEKFLLALKDKHLIEAVIIPAQKRGTACVSSQVGCKFACKFCASGLLGFKRNLSCAEIIAQLLLLKNQSSQKITHLVFMGTGEPLDNYADVLKSIRIINEPLGFNLGARRITLSTCGITPGIKKLAEENLQVELSISLHAADEKTRSKIMPINKIYPLKELILACQDYIQRTNRQITFEYILIQKVNSDLQNAQNLCRILKSLKSAKVNLIPANPVKELGIVPPGKLEILFFRDYLLKQGINVTLRKPRGVDIEAACGQLRLRYEK